MCRRDSSSFVGLNNQGATCYMNSLIQTLFMTPEFRDAILFWDYDPSLADARDSIPYQLQLLFARLSARQRSAVDTRDLTQSFGWDNSNTSQQCDVNEFCRVFFAACQRQMKGTSNASLIDRLYHGRLQHYVKFGPPSHAQMCTDDVIDELTIDILREPGSTATFRTVHESMDKFFEEELMTGDNQLYCDRTETMVDARKGCKLRRVPHILNLSLKRYTNDYGGTKKLNDCLEFPFVLDMNKYCDAPWRQDWHPVFPIAFQRSAKALRQCVRAKVGDADRHRSDTTSTICQRILQFTTTSWFSKGGDGADMDIDAQSKCDATSNGYDAGAASIEDMEALRQKSGPYVYELLAVMVQSGSATSGHYYAHIKSMEDRKWYNFNDSRVYESSPEDVKSSYGTKRASIRGVNGSGSFGSFGSGGDQFGWDSNDYGGGHEFDGNGLYYEYGHRDVDRRRTWESKHSFHASDDVYGYGYGSSNSDMSHGTSAYQLVYRRYDPADTKRMASGTVLADRAALLLRKERDRIQQEEDMKPDWVEVPTFHFSHMIAHSRKTHTCPGDFLASSSPFSRCGDSDSAAEARYVTVNRKASRDSIVASIALKWGITVINTDGENAGKAMVGGKQCDDWNVVRPWNLRLRHFDSRDSRPSSIVETGDDIVLLHQYDSFVLERKTNWDEFDEPHVGSLLWLVPHYRDDAPAWYGGGCDEDNNVGYFGKRRHMFITTSSTVADVHTEVLNRFEIPIDKQRLVTLSRGGEEVHVLSPPTQTLQSGRAGRFPTLSQGDTVYVEEVCRRTSFQMYSLVQQCYIRNKNMVDIAVTDLDRTDEPDDVVTVKCDNRNTFAHLKRLIAAKLGVDSDQIRLQRDRTPHRRLLESDEAQEIDVRTIYCERGRPLKAHEAVINILGEKAGTSCMQAAAAMRGWRAIGRGFTLNDACAFPSSFHNARFLLLMCLRRRCNTSWQTHKLAASVLSFCSPLWFATRSGDDDLDRGMHGCAAGFTHFQTSTIAYDTPETTKWMSLVVSRETTARTLRDSVQSELLQRGMMQDYSRHSVMRLNKLNRYGEVSRVIRDDGDETVYLQDGDQFCCTLVNDDNEISIVDTVSQRQSMLRLVFWDRASNSLGRPGYLYVPRSVATMAELRDHVSRAAKMDADNMKLYCPNPYHGITLQQLAAGDDVDYYRRVNDGDVVVFTDSSVQIQSCAGEDARDSDGDGLAYGQKSCYTRSEHIVIAGRSEREASHVY